MCDIYAHICPLDVTLASFSPALKNKKGDILQTNGAVTCVFLFDTDDIECDAYLRSEKQLSLELKTLERKLKEEDERRIVEYEVERKKEQNEQREKEEGRKRRQRDFEEELRQIEEDNRVR